MWDTLTTVAGLALPQLLDGALQAVGGGPVSLVTGPVTTLLRQTFVDNSAGVERALQQAEHRAWRAIELALAGRTGTLAKLTDGADTTGFAAAVRGYLDSLPADRLPAGLARPEFADRCLSQLAAARAAGLIGDALSRAGSGTKGTGSVVGPAEMAALAEQTAGDLRFRSPQDRLARQWAVLDGLAERLRAAGHAELALLVSARPPANESLLAAAVKYFFRQAVEEDERLHRGLTWATWEAVTEDLRVGLERVTELQIRHAAKLEQSLTGLAAMLAAGERKSQDRHCEVISKLDRIEQLVEKLAPSSEQIAVLPPAQPTPVLPARPTPALPSREAPTAPPRAINPIFLRPAQPLAGPPAIEPRINLSKEHTELAAPPTAAPPTAAPPTAAPPTAAPPTAPAAKSASQVPLAFLAQQRELRRGQPLSDLLGPRAKGPPDKSSRS